MFWLLGSIWMTLMVLRAVAWIAGARGVLFVVILGLAGMTVLIFGGLASVAFSVGLRGVGWVLVGLMAGLLVYLGWCLWNGLR